MRAVDGRSEAAVIWRPEQGGTVPKIAEGELERFKATPKGAAERVEAVAALSTYRQAEEPGLDDPGGQFGLPRKRFLVSRM
jgi:hypothetical protein